MRWFKHLTAARHNPKLRKLEKELGEGAYARWFKLLEMVGEQGDTGEDFKPRISLKDPHTGLDWVADEWNTSEPEASTTLQAMARVGLIDKRSYNRRAIYVPKMIDYRDEWTRKRQRQHSEATPEPLRSKSPQSQSQSQSQSQNTELEREVESESDGDDRKADSTSPPVKRKAFDSDRDLFLTVTKGRFDYERGFKGYTHRGSFTFAVADLAKGGVPTTDEEGEQFMGAVVDACEDKGFKVPPGWIRALSDLRRELGIAK